MDWLDDKHGIIIGSHEPNRQEVSRSPDWMDPEAARARRQLPSLMIALETVDGGKTWSANSTSMFGRITRHRMHPSGIGLQLIEFMQYFDWPSEVYRADVKKFISARVYREKDRAITDLTLLSNRTAYLAGYEPPGALARLGVPGKLVILRSTDLDKWEEMEVDYRATARRAFLSNTRDNTIWAATDTGMILRLVVGQ